ncbi:DUF7173 family protein [Photobacterium halotolerans]|uniref:DUF7173 family protein n=1 Tax=Photobacterium halotolerans TaxID=265726 RepID=UPI000401C009|nr:hypothetical protein [Photobacterium halotolerans]
MERTIDAVASELNDINTQIKYLSTCKSQLESELISLVGVKEEGACNAMSGAFKVTTTGKLSRSFLPDVSYADVEKAVGTDAARDLVKHEMKIKVSALRNLDDSQQMALSHLIVTKPAKTAVKLETTTDE